MKNLFLLKLTLIMGLYLITIPLKVSAMGPHMQLIDIEEEENKVIAYGMSKFPGREDWGRFTAFVAGENCVGGPAHAFLNERGEAAEQVIISFGTKQVTKKVTKRKCCGCIKYEDFYEDLVDQATAIINSPLVVVPKQYSDSPQCSEFDVALLSFINIPPSELSEAGIYAPWYNGIHPVQMAFPTTNFIYGTTAFTLADTYGVSNLDVFEEEELRGAPIVIKGYPKYFSAAGRADTTVHNAFASLGMITDVRDNIFFHNCITAKGLSGAPVYLEGSVCGIHSGAFATRINNEVLDFFEASLSVLDKRTLSS